MTVHSYSHLSDLLDLMRDLTRASIHHDISAIREDAVMLSIAVPGQRWEIEIFVDGHVEVEIFESTGDIGSAETLQTLFERFRD